MVYLQDETIKHYLKKGADQEKLVVGIPTYGRSFTLLNPEASEINSQAEGPGKKGEATKEKGYLAYYEVKPIILVFHLLQTVKSLPWLVMMENYSVIDHFLLHSRISVLAKFCFNFRRFAQP